VAESPPHIDLFVSYAQDEDGARAREFADRIGAAGASVWMAERSIAGAENYALEVVAAIDACKVFVILCSPASMASPHVAVELQLAFESGKPRLPLVLEPTTPTGQMRYWLAGANRVEVDGDADQWVPEVVRALQLLGVDCAEARDPSSELENRRRMSETVTLKSPPPVPRVRARPGEGTPAYSPFRPDPPPRPRPKT
jgi:hypothetical protein